MIAFIRTLALSLLLFVSMTALYGGFSFLQDPSGAGLKMSLMELRYSPFGSYLVPGLFLFFVIGLGSLLGLFFFVTHHPLSHQAMIVIGIVLITWIFVQIIMLRNFNTLQIVYSGAGALLVMAGLCLQKKKSNVNP